MHKRFGEYGKVENGDSWELRRAGFDVGRNIWENSVEDGNWFLISFLIWFSYYLSFILTQKELRTDKIKIKCNLIKLLEELDILSTLKSNK